ncbi:MAG: glycogen debranching protein GlgX, partial [Cyclobacteriaceae bacterium]|nr:glycogen debranching protein GlgX [Cyclobacteriaceae bacterium]
MADRSATSHHIQHGLPFPIGPRCQDGGVNFCLFSRNARRVELLLYHTANDKDPYRTLSLDPVSNRTYHYWHVFVPGLKAGQLYAYRVDGHHDPAQGHRFNASIPLLDPYAKTIAFPQTRSKAGNGKGVPWKSVVCDMSKYNWEDDEHPRTPFSQTVIYEMHVAGFTKHPNSGVSPDKRGTYAGLIEKIPYLVDLGVTAVELLPVFQFDDKPGPQGRKDYWGYSPVSFFALHQGYSSDPTPLGSLAEFRNMVKELHKAGIEVILDVVFNHTGEGGEDGPTYSFRGIDNSVYYSLEQGNLAKYANYSGTGNTMNANHPAVRRMIIDSLHYWVKEMHVDGFRFDLASILARDHRGHIIENPPILWDIESDPILAGTKLIAEAWDAAGLYQVGTFVGDSWKEWNGKFRDDVRSFMKGDNGVIKRFASRLVGSPDIYGKDEREPEQSINFITCHDGFTLNDLVSYNSKHNEANGEDNRDGTDHNLSWNGGVEGPTDDPAIEDWRNRQIRNFFSITLLSVGAPMLSMGDEVRRTQRGNNNAYCQDNELSWFDWDLVKKNQDLFRFVRELIRMRLMRESAQQQRYPMNLREMLEQRLIAWHGVRL